MYGQQNDPWNTPNGSRQRPPRAPGNAMATASLACAVIALITICTFYGAVVFGALSVIFALLSRGTERQFSTSGKYGLRIGLISMLVSVAVIGASFGYVYTQYGSMDNFIREYSDVLESTYGIDVDQYLDSSDGTDSDSGSDTDSGTGSNADSGSNGSVMIEDSGAQQL